jgi:phosphopantetheine adenylyltransferase
MPPRDIAEVSSSLVKGFIGPQGWEKLVKDYVTEPVFKKLKEKHGSQKP